MYPALEDQLVELFANAMEESEKSQSATRLLWRTLGSEMIFFVLYQYMNFGSFVEKLADILVPLPYR